MRLFIYGGRSDSLESQEKKKIFRPLSKMKMQAHTTFGTQFEKMPSPDACLGKNTDRWSWVEGVGGCWETLGSGGSACGLPRERGQASPGIPVLLLPQESSSFSSSPSASTPMRHPLREWWLCL